MSSVYAKRFFSFEEIKAVAAEFDIQGTVYMAYTYGSGHINDTYVIETFYKKKMRRYILQRINTEIFKKPDQVMDNIKLVTEKQHSSIKARGGNPLEESLTLINTKSGKHFYKSTKGATWRGYYFIEGACTYNYIKNDKRGMHLVYEAARIFGEFQRQLADLPPDKLHETIPFFHHTPKRLEQLTDAISFNYENRKKKCEKEIEFALSRRGIAPVLINLMEKGEIPVRVCHNDTKINNVMFDYTGETEKAKVIIDLDTLMPGTPLYDFGDLVRTTTCPAAEDETDISKVVFDISLYEQLVRGFLDGTGDLLTGTEKEHLAFAGKLITYNIGIRFLADYLTGDKYFKTHHPDHNITRARTQFKLIEEMERDWAIIEEMSFQTK